jgi:glutamate/tyrosine decarboxylase-like PLP-dependent enzyme
MKKDRTEHHDLRTTPFGIEPAAFRQMGYEMVDRISDLLENIGKGQITRGEDAGEIQRTLQADRKLPVEGTPPQELLRKAADLLFEHSLYNGHPRFWGYITASPLPSGMLADLLASAVNANTGAWILSPMASEMERQAVRWIGEFIGFPSGGGLMVSGGNMANFVGFLAGMRAIAGGQIRADGLDASPKKLVCYCSDQVHTWVQKAADLFGLGTRNIRWIPTDPAYRMDTVKLKNQIELDLAQGYRPFLVVGTAGSVSLGVVDPLKEIRLLCDEFGLWFHVDGAYGGFAAAVPEFEPDISGLQEADSVAVDPHKWLYAPLEAGCVLVRDPKCLTDTFSYHPPYYNFEDHVVNYVDYGMQNSRGFRALKVWLTLQELGLNGYKRLIRDDILLAQQAYRLLDDQSDFEVRTWHLSITTFRYLPIDLVDQSDREPVRKFMNELNKEILNRIQSDGEYFVSNAVIDDHYVMRLCIVNFRTTLADVEAFPAYVRTVGREIDQGIRPQHLND